MYPARNPDEITASFDWVIYDKAASIMKMMEEALGKENYDQAINKLLIRVLEKLTTGNFWSFCFSPLREIQIAVIFRKYEKKDD